jgi:hypothetical protein
MSMAEAVRGGPLALRRAIEGQIVRRAGQRVRGLGVEVNAGRVVVRGLVGSYHVKQLVVVAILEVLAVAGHIPAVEVRVHVEAPGTPAGGENGPAR